MIQRKRQVLMILAAGIFTTAGVQAEKRGMGPRTTYEKSSESTTGVIDAGAGSCLTAAEAGDVKAVMAAFKRHSRQAEELRKSFVEESDAHTKRQAHLAELDRQLAEASDTERAILQSQPKSPQVAEVRAIQSQLRKQKEELAAYDRAQEAAQNRLLNEITKAQRCAREIATKRDEMRQGALEEQRGTVEWRRKGSGSGWDVPAGEVVLHPGDSIRTREDGHVRLRLPDGSLMELGPSAGFTLSADPGIFGEQLYGSILYKIQQYMRKMEVRTPAAVCAVRGTEFSLKTSSGTATQLTAVDGHVEFTARPGAADAARQTAWWAGLAPSTAAESLPGGTFAKLGEGSARVKHPGGVWKTAPTGELFKADDLVRADAAPVALELSGGIAALLAPGSVLQLRQDKDGHPLYGLWRGRLYGRRPAGTAGPEPTFTSPTAVCAVRGTEFEYHVPEAEAPEFIIYDGAIDVTADEKRFQNPELFRAWWED
ncbi:MAG: FecR domain-containing protein [Elusimicrobiota bacterium]